MNLESMDKMFGQGRDPINKDWCILDSQSTCDCFCSGKYLQNIRQINQSIVIRCNSGVRTTNWVGDLPGYPQPVWFDKGGIANIISLKNCEKFFKVTYDSEDNNGFVVTHRTNGSVRHFHQSRKVLHYLDLSKQLNKSTFTKST